MSTDAQPGNRGLLVVGLSVYAVLSLVSMAAMNIGAGLLGICVLFSIGPSRLGRAFRDLFADAPAEIRYFSWISLGFALACVLSLVVARYAPLEIGGHSAHFGILRSSAKIWYFAWPFVLWLALSACSREQRKKILLVWFCAFGVLSLIGIQQHFTGWPRPQLIPPTGPILLKRRFHATLFLGHHLSVASVFIFPFFALLDLPRSGFLRGPLRWLCLAAGLVTLVFTYSRTLWIALPIGLVFWALLRFGRSFGQRFGKKAIFALLAFSVFGAAIAYQVPAVHGRLTAQMGIHEREDLWEANWRFFLDRPLTGVGLKLNQELSGYYLMQKYHTSDVFEGHAHDNVLDVLGSMGLVGFAAFVAWWVALVALVLRPFRVARAAGTAVMEVSAPFFGTGLLAALLVFQLNGLTQVNFWEGKVQHQLMWMVAWALLWCAEAAHAA